MNLKIAVVTIIDYNFIITRKQSLTHIKVE